MMRRRAIMGGKTGPAPLIPAEYQQVEYLEIPSTATAGPFYRTGYSPPNTGEIVLECEFMATSYASTTSNSYPLACTASTSTNNVGVGIYLLPATSDRNKITIFNGVSISAETDTTTQVNVRRFVKATFKDTGYEKIEVDNQFTNDGTTASGSLRTRTGPICLFGVKKYNSNQLNTFFRGRIYRAKVYLDGVLKVDMVPCYRKSDSTPGFYERVAGTFVTKTGSGTSAINLGPDVT